MTSRQRVLDSTLQLLRRQGLSATGLNEIIKESKAPRGSIYHHFPGGKEELTAETLRIAGEAVAVKIRAALESSKDTTAALRKYVAGYAQEIRDSNYERGCPVGNVAIDAAATSPKLRKICEDIFNTWEALIAERLTRDGFSKSEAASLAEFILSSLEGALILCRSQRSTKPLDRVAERLADILTSAKRR